MLWPFNKHLLAHSEVVANNDSLETYINHATADGASWEEEIYFTSAQTPAETADNTVPAESFENN